jgi:CheY-like chemotaxis protein/two-component sensor histidine kinase
MELTFEDVYLPDIIESVMSTARGLIKDKPVRLITAIADDLPTITADSTRVRQILLNLISNSAKFTDEGSITVTARKQTGANGQPEIYISVTDTGIGITPEDSKKLFQPFVQVDGSPTRKTGGTGLGLSITRLLVELHGGEINLESDIGKGSTFYFTLPVHGKKAQPEDGESSAVVLSIDSDPRVIQLYEQYLSNSRYQITPLTDPSRAIELAREIQPFAITLDIMLPGHDGWQILQGLQEDPETKHIPIIICSILEDTGKGLKLGAHEYLTKPILKDDLMRALNRIKS